MADSPRRCAKLSTPDDIRHVATAIVASNDPKNRDLGMKEARCIIIVQMHADIHVASDMVRTHVQPGDRCYMECALDSTRSRAGAVQAARSVRGHFHAKLKIAKPPGPSLLMLSTPSMWRIGARGLAS
jgi:hypothetical protein